MVWGSEPLRHATWAEHAGCGGKPCRAHLEGTLLALGAFAAAKEALDSHGGAVVPGDLEGAVPRRAALQGGQRDRGGDLDGVARHLYGVGG